MAAKAEAEAALARAPLYNPRPENVDALLALVRITAQASPRTGVLDVVENRLRMARGFRCSDPAGRRTAYQTVIALVTGIDGASNYKQMLEMVSFLREKGQVVVEPAFFDSMRA